MAKFSTANSTPEQREFQAELARTIKTVDAPAHFGGGVGGSGKMPDFSEEVRRGADLLDRLLPGWEQEIDLSTLDLADESRCVLGQTFPLYARLADLKAETLSEAEDTNYRRFLQEVYPTAPDTDAASSSAAEIGFSVSGPVWAWVNTSARASRDYIPAQITAAMVFEHLSRTWVEEITRRKALGRLRQHIPAKL